MPTIPAPTTVAVFSPLSDKSISSHNALTMNLELGFEVDPDADYPARLL